MYIVIVSFPVDDVINFEVNHSFPHGRFAPWTKKLRQTFRYLKNEKSF